MPGVSATHGWIPWESAKKQLEEAGYLVEFTGSESCGSLFVRTGPNSSWSRMDVNYGKCSPRTVGRLVKKLKR